MKIELGACEEKTNINEKNGTLESREYNHVRHSLSTIVPHHPFHYEEISK